MKRHSGLKSWFFANPFPLGTFLMVALLLSPILALPLLGETAGTSQLQQMDVNDIREDLYNKYDRTKQQIFADHGVKMNPDGTPNRNAPGYETAIKKIQPVHDNMMESAKVLDKARDEINQKIFKEAGVKPPKMTGTDPQKGRGIFGDAEGTARSPQEYDKLVKTLEKNKIPFVKEGDYIKIKGSDTVIHRPASKFGEKVGGSGHQARVSAQTGGPETAGSASGQKKYQGVGGNIAGNDVKGAALDSAKKMQDAVNSKPETPWQKANRDQIIAKETLRINEAAGGKPDPSLTKVKAGGDPALQPELKGPVKETALKQTQESWPKIEKQHQENMAKLDKAINDPRTPPKAKEYWKSQKIDMTSRHEETMKTIDGKALNEVKGQPPSAQEIGKSTASKPGSTEGTKGTKGMAGIEEATASGKGGGKPVSESPLAKGEISEGSGRTTGAGKSMPERTGEPKGSGASPKGAAAGGLENTRIGKLGITTELPAGTGGLRTGLNTGGGYALKGLGLYGIVVGGYQVTKNTAEALGALAGGDKKEAFEKGKDVVTDVGMFGGSLAIAAASPTAGVVMGAAGVGVGTYAATRYGLENTKVGQAIDKGVEGTMITSYEYGKAKKEKVDDFIRGKILGRETNAEKAEKEKVRDTGKLVSSGLSETKAKEYMEAKEKMDRGEITTDKFRQIAKDIRESKNSDKISGLRDSEAKTDQKDRSNNHDPEGKKAGMDLAKNTNLTDSYQKDRSDKTSKETQQTQSTAGSTLSEKIVASHARNLEEQSRTTAQGKLTETAISQTQQESTQAQKIDQLEKNTAIGTILVGSLMGGLTSGVAIGLDSALGTLGRGAGEQASISTGIKPKPEPVPPPTSAPASTTATTPAPAPTATSTPAPAPTSTTASTPAPAPTSTATSKPAPTTTPAPAPTSTTASKPAPAPTSTSPSKPSPSQGSTPDCSVYRSSAEALTASYVRGSMATSAYKSQMAALRTKYKGCNEVASAPPKTVSTPPGTVSTPPKTSVTSTTPTQGATITMPNLNGWRCARWEEGCCFQAWLCEGEGKCGDLPQQALLASAQACEKLDKKKKLYTPTITGTY
jgi:hypothetical protein